MGHSRFVKPQEIVLPISHGQTLTVKRRLNSGEQRAMFDRMYIQQPDGTLHVNPLRSGLCTVLAYLLDWTVTDDDGVLVPIRGLSEDEVISALDMLSPEDFAEIKEVIQEHVEKQRKQREAEKNAQDGESKSPVTSPSPVDSTGVMSGSAI